jgi:hypothetical protein
VAACWNETYREKGDVERGGWADVARQLPVTSSVWISVPRSLSRRVFVLNQYDEFAPKTIWSLSNDFASTFKDLNPISQFKKFARLGEFLQTILKGVILSFSDAYHVAFF